MPALAIHQRGAFPAIIVLREHGDRRMQRSIGHRGAAGS
jgi:hypothetical protein